MPEWTVIRAEIAGRKRHHPDADVSELRRKLALARVEAKIAAAVEAAPPLPADVAGRLVELIRTASPATGEATAA